MTHERDKVYADPRPMIVDFTFDESVAAVFPDMIRRSVPGYDAIITQLGLFAERYVQPDSYIYDLGCSLGAATLAMRRHARAHNCRIIAVDNADAMVERCRQHMANDSSSVPVEIRCGDVRQTPIENASLVVLNFTLQFLAHDERLPLLQKIAAGMRRGGVLVLSEKIVADDPTEQAFQDGMHMQFKRANGYSEMEISQKRTALENVLIPDTIDTHTERLHQAGFTNVHIWFRSFNFVSFAAFR